MIHDSYYSKNFKRHLVGNEKSFIFSKNSKVSLNINMKSKINIDLYGKIKVGDGKLLCIVYTSSGHHAFDIRFSSNSNSKKSIVFENQNFSKVEKISIIKKYNTIGKVELSRIIVYTEDEENQIYSREIDIGIIVPYSIYGGGEIYLKNIISFPSVHPYNFHFIYMKPNKLEKNISKNKNIFSYKAKNESEILKIIKDKNIKSIIFYNSKNVYMMLKSMQKKINFKILEIYHSDFTWADSISKLAHHDVDCLIKVSESVGNHICTKRVEVCRVPIDVNEFIDKDGDFERKTFDIKPKSIGVISRISKEKNLDYILELCREMPHTFFYIVGDGVGRPDLESKIIVNNLKNIKILGWVEDVSKIINAFSAIVLPSKKEGTPISIIEGMSCNIPSFCYRSGGIPKLLDGGAYELSLEPTIDSYNIYQEMNSRVNTRKFVVQNFSDKIISDNFIKILNSIFILNYKPIRNVKSIKGGFYV